MQDESLKKLEIIKENEALGSGLQIAQYDLELRGAGDLLGKNQSGFVNSIGYELFFELLEECLREQKGETLKSIEPNISILESAFLPDSLSARA